MGGPKNESSVPQAAVSVFWGYACYSHFSNKYLKKQGELCLNCVTIMSQITVTQLVHNGERGITNVNIMMLYNISIYMYILLTCFNMLFNS
jgi:hypothetical protein